MTVGRSVGPVGHAEYYYDVQPKNHLTLIKKGGGVQRNTWRLLLLVDALDFFVVLGRKLPTGLVRLVVTRIGLMVKVTASVAWRSSLIWLSMIFYFLCGALLLQLLV